MPAKKKTIKKTAKKKTSKKAAPRKVKKTYVCVPCGTEVTITKEGMGVTHLMCCGRLMRPKTTKR